MTRSIGARGLARVSPIGATSELLPPFTGSEDLKPECVDTGMSAAEKKAKREEEIDALKSALCQLDGEGVEPEC